MLYVWMFVAQQVADWPRLLPVARSQFPFAALRGAEETRRQVIKKTAYLQARARACAFPVLRGHCAACCSHACACRAGAFPALRECSCNNLFMRALYGVYYERVPRLLRSRSEQARNMLGNGCAARHRAQGIARRLARDCVSHGKAGCTRELRNEFLISLVCTIFP